MPARAPLGGRPPRQPKGGDWLRLALGYAQRSFGLDEERRDRLRADRADRLRRLTEDPEGVWQLDVLPLLTELFDQVQDEVIAGNKHPDALLALRAAVFKLDEARVLGAQALTRWTERRSRSAVVTAAHAQAATPSEG